MAISLARTYPGPNRCTGGGPAGPTGVRRVDLRRDVRQRPTPSADGHQSDPWTAAPAPSVVGGAGLVTSLDRGVVRSAVDSRDDPCAVTALMSLAPDVVLRKRRRACTRRQTTGPSDQTRRHSQVGKHHHRTAVRSLPPPAAMDVLPEQADLNE